MEKDILCKWKAKTSRGSYTYVRQNGLHVKPLRRNKNHYIMIKVLIHQEKKVIMNTYAPNIGASKYIKQMLTALKGKIDRNSIIIKDFNTPLSAMNGSSRPKINKEILYLKYVLDQMELTDMHITCHPIAIQHILLKHNGTFSKKNHMLGHNTNHMLGHSIEIISCICSDLYENRK